jgi:hypothetical protein
VNGCLDTSRSGSDYNYIIDLSCHAFLLVCSGKCETVLANQVTH